MSEIIIRFIITCKECGRIHPVFLSGPKHDWPDKLPCPWCLQNAEYTVERA